MGENKMSRLNNQRVNKTAALQMTKAYGGHKAGGTVWVEGWYLRMADGTWRHEHSGVVMSHEKFISNLRSKSGNISGVKGGELERSHSYGEDSRKSFPMQHQRTIVANRSIQRAKPVPVAKRKG